MPPDSPARRKSARRTRKRGARFVDRKAEASNDEDVLQPAECAGAILADAAGTRRCRE
jgi:hypothetical protein